jgi:hypothetical protein
MIEKQSKVDVPGEITITEVDERTNNSDEVEDENLY